MSGLRSLLASLRDRERVVTVASGPAAGLRIGLRNASADYGDGGNELPVQEAIAARLRPGSVFYDVGANVGFFTLLAGRIVGPTGRVESFEAVPANAGCVTRNAARNDLGQVGVHAVAVGRAAGVATLHLAVHPGGAVLASAGAPPDAAGTIEVPVVVLDELVETGALPPPDLVKIDVEGAEEDVLAGLRRTIERHHPALLIEVDGPAAADLEARVGAFDRELRAQGYEVHRLAGSYAESEWHVAHLVAEVLEGSPHDASPDER